MKLRSLDRRALYRGDRQLERRLDECGGERSPHVAAPALGPVAHEVGTPAPPPSGRPSDRGRAPSRCGRPRSVASKMQTEVDGSAPRRRHAAYMPVPGPAHTTIGDSQVVLAVAPVADVTLRCVCMSAAATRRGRRDETAASAERAFWRAAARREGSPRRRRVAVARRLADAESRGHARGVQRSGVRADRVPGGSLRTSRSVVGKTASGNISKRFSPPPLRSDQPRHEHRRHLFLYAAQSSPYLSEQKWSSRTARWMSSTAK